MTKVRGTSSSWNLLVNNISLQWINRTPNQRVWRSGRCTAVLFCDICCASVSSWTFIRNSDKPVTSTQSPHDDLMGAFTMRIYPHVLFSAFKTLYLTVWYPLASQTLMRTRTDSCYFFLQTFIFQIDMSLFFFSIGSIVYKPLREQKS